MALHRRGCDWVQERLCAFRDGAQHGFKFLQQHNTPNSGKFSFLIQQHTIHTDALCHYNKQILLFKVSFITYN